MYDIKQALRSRRLAVGSWIQTGSQTAAEIACDAGCDWLGVDCEHSDIGLREMTAVLRAAYGRGTAPLVRVGSNDFLAIRQALDMGAAGVIVPMVNTADDARKAVRAALYPPAGERGFGYCRANGWGERFDRYAASANAGVAVIAMIETKEGLQNAEEILTAEGVDGIFVGPYDLSGSLGVTGRTEHPLVNEACRKLAGLCAKHGRSAGRHIVRPTAQAVRSAIEEGYTFLALGADIVFLAEGVRNALGLAEDKR